MATRFSQFSQTSPQLGDIFLFSQTTGGVSTTYFGDVRDLQTRILSGITVYSSTSAGQNMILPVIGSTAGPATAPYYTTLRDIQTFVRTSVTSYSGVSPTTSDLIPGVRTSGGTSVSYNMLLADLQKLISSPQKNRNLLIMVVQKFAKDLVERAILLLQDIV